MIPQRNLSLLANWLAKEGCLRISSRVGTCVIEATSAFVRASMV